jgi:hypothetical protein
MKSSSKTKIQLDLFVEAVMRALQERYFISESSSAQSSSPTGSEGRIYGIGTGIIQLKLY